MRTIVLAALFTLPALAQNVPPNPAACGPANVSFKVNVDASQHTSPAPEPGKARIYFIHDAGTGWEVGYPTVKVAVDGTWVGANHGNSYFSISVDPGEHHLCTTLQSSLVEQRVELAHFTATADAVQYYRTRLVLTRNVELLELESIDEDQGKYLIATFPLAIARPKK